MSKVEDNWKNEEHVPLNGVEQKVYSLDDEFEVKFFHKFHQERDCLLKRYNQNMISWSWLSYQDYEYKEDQISIDQVVHWYPQVNKEYQPYSVYWKWWIKFHWANQVYWDDDYSSTYSCLIHPVYVY